MQERLAQLAEEEEEAGEAEYQYLARQEAGLYTLQQVALVVGNLWFVGDMGVRKRLLQLLHQQVPPALPSALPWGACCSEARGGRPRGHAAVDLDFIVLQI